MLWPLPKSAGMWRRRDISCYSCYAAEPFRKGSPTTGSAGAKHASPLLRPYALVPPPGPLPSPAAGRREGEKRGFVWRRPAAAAAQSLSLSPSIPLSPGRRPGGEGHQGGEGSEKANRVKAEHPDGRVQTPPRKVTAYISWKPLGDRRPRPVTRRRGGVGSGGCRPDRRDGCWRKEAPKMEFGRWRRQRGGRAAEPPGRPFPCAWRSLPVAAQRRVWTPCGGQCIPVLAPRGG
jgi:hypothetical protein